MPNRPGYRDIPPRPKFSRLFTDNPRAGQKLDDFIDHLLDSIATLIAGMQVVLDNGKIAVRQAIRFVTSNSIFWSITDNMLEDRIDVQASVRLSEVELVFGPPARVEQTFIVTDDACTEESHVVMIHSGNAATDRQADEAEFDAIDCRCEAQSGQFKVYATSLLGSVVGRYKFSYLVSPHPFIP